jgi:hypothetical protein
MGVWFVLSGMFCFFIAYLSDKRSKESMADAMIFTGVLLIALAALF